MSGELKPCPFCGGENIRIGYYEPYEHTVRLFYYCNSCGARGGDQNSDERLAIAAWNTRAQPPESPTTDDKVVEGTNTSETAKRPSEDDLERDTVIYLLTLLVDGLRHDEYKPEFIGAVHIAIKLLQEQGETIKPCPKCGGEGELGQQLVNGSMMYSIKCTQCKHEVLSYDTPGEVVTKWNTRQESEALPEPCTNVSERTVKEWFAKIDEELNELKAAVLAVESNDEGYRNLANDTKMIKNFKHDYQAEQLAEEAADTITAITSMLEAMGITLAERQEAQRRVNARNRERNRL